MEKNDDLHKFLQESMHQYEGEQSEPNPEIQQRVRAKIQSRMPVNPTSANLFSRIRTLLNLEIKLYQAGLAMGVFAAFLICLPLSSPAPKTGESVVLADSIKPITCSSAKENKFLIRNFVVKEN